MQDSDGLIIFDCDGVLIDSEPLSARVSAEELTLAGFPFDAEEVDARFTGMSDVNMYATIEREFGRSLPDDLDDRINTRLMAAFAQELVAINGICQVLDRLDGEHRRYCVASSSTPQRLSTTLRHVGLYRRFGAIFSASMVERGKPAPDLFLHAARDMGVPPGACFVVEDSVAGVTAAQAAGMVALGFDGGSHCKAGHARNLTNAGANVVFSDMMHLPDLLENLPQTQNVV